MIAIYNSKIHLTFTFALLLFANFFLSTFSTAPHTQQLIIAKASKAASILEKRSYSSVDACYQAIKKNRSEVREMPPPVPEEYQSSILGAFRKIQKDHGVYRWLIQPGMNFGDSHTWWNEKSRWDSHREKSHSGIDLAVYLDQERNMRSISEKPLQIPAFSSGKVHWIFEDTMQTTIFVKSGGYFFIYTHVIPRNDLKVGDEVKAGEIIASAQRTDKNRIAPHAHLGIATNIGLEDQSLSSAAINYDVLNEWQTQGRITYLSLLDALPSIDRQDMFLEKDSAKSIIQTIDIQAPLEDFKKIKAELLIAFPGLKKVSLIKEGQSLPENFEILIQITKDAFWNIQIGALKIESLNLETVLKELELYERNLYDLQNNIIDRFTIEMDEHTESIWIQKKQNDKNPNYSDIVSLPETGADPYALETTNSRFVYTAYNSEGRLIGYQFCEIINKEVYFHATAIDTSYQRHRIFSKLLTAAIKDALHLGYENGYSIIEWQGVSSGLHSFLVRHGARVEYVGLCFDEELDSLSNGSDEDFDSEAQARRNLVEINQLEEEARISRTFAFFAQYPLARFEIYFSLQQMLDHLKKNIKLPASLHSALVPVGARSEIRLQQTHKVIVLAPQTQLSAVILLNAWEFQELDKNKAQEYFDELAIILNENPNIYIYFDSNTPENLQTEAIRKRFPKQVIRNQLPNTHQKMLFVQASLFSNKDSKEKTQTILETIRQKHQMNEDIQPLDYSEPGSLGAFLTLAETFGTSNSLLLQVSDEYMVRGANNRWQISKTFLSTVWQQIQNGYATAWAT